MSRPAGPTAGDAAGAFVSWLTTAALGPAVVAVPVNWAAGKLADAAVRWFKRCRRTDDLSRLVKAATDTSIDLSDIEFKKLRKLLEKEQTWRLLAGGELKAGELTGQIAACLPERDGRTADDALEAAGTIARGLLEFAVFDLEPGIFQRVVLARLQQMTDEVSARDKALFAVHKDLYARVDAAMDLFKRVVEVLPPGPAGRGEIVIYLKILIDWLNADQWPREQRLGGPVLIPAAIERKLWMVSGQGREQELDADNQAKRCERLVVLGGPGSGKTWLAKRTARICAEDALGALEADTTLDEVELPLYTTCSRLAGAPGDIREAVVSSSIEWVGDLGGSRITEALRRLFAERDTPTLLVIDSLDEASDVDVARERLRQADSLRHPWRVVLTSRPSSWDGQLNIEEGNQAHRVGELQPLRYPGDVEPVIQQWFADKPERGRALAAQIADRPSLQQAATVPLILAFYCILGGQQPLPEYRHDLYKRVINRMLRGPWRPRGSRPPDPDACREALRNWAWQGARNHEISGVGQWDDDVPTQQAQLSPAGQEAVDHIAAPRGGPDFDTDEISRRFVHRSIREHLVAEHVASLTAGQAVKELFPHLWYDPDWEYTAPAALAMHGEHDKVLRALICRANRSNDLPGDLSAIDAGHEVRKLLARVAAESSEDDWSSEAATTIGQARVQLAGMAADLAEAARWPTSNRLIRQALLRLLTADIDGWEAARLADTLAQLDPAPREKRETIEVLLRHLADDALDAKAQSLAYMLVRFDPGPADKRQARETLLARLTDNESPDELIGALLWLEPTPEDEQRARGTLLGRLARLADPANDTADPFPSLTIGPVADGLTQLDLTPEDRRQAYDTVLGLLADAVNGLVAQGLVATLLHLDTTPAGKRHALDAVLAMLTGRITNSTADPLAATVLDLAQTAEDKRRALDAMIGHLSGQGPMAQAARLIIVQLDPTPDDKRRAVDALLALLGRGDSANAPGLASLIARLDPTPDDRHRGRATLLGLLTAERLDEVIEGQVAPGPFASHVDASRAADLAAAVLQLDPTPDDKRQARHALLGLLTSQATGAADEEETVLGLLASRNRGSLCAELAALVLQLDPDSGDKRQALDALLALLASEAIGAAATDLAALVAQLDPTPDDKRQARDALLALFDTGEGWNADRLAIGLVELDATSEDKRHARHAMLGRLRGKATGVAAEAIAAGLTRLDATANDRRRARETLLGQLGGRRPGTVAELVSVALQLAPAPDDKRHVLDALLGLLPCETDSAVAAEFVRGMAQLDPTVHALSTWRAWTTTPTAELLAAVRRNSALDEWLQALPSLSLLSC